MSNNEPPDQDQDDNQDSGTVGSDGKDGLNVMRFIAEHEKLFAELRKHFSDYVTCLVYLHQSFKLDIKNIEKSFASVMEAQELAAQSLKASKAKKPKK